MECTVKLAELENPKLKSLMGKTFAGKIDNISAGGLKLLCGFDFPIKDKIVLEFSFDIYLKFKTEDLHLYRWGMNVFAPLGALVYLNLILYVFNI